jgi:hypothetical protein
MRYCLIAATLALLTGCDAYTPTLTEVVKVREVVAPCRVYTWSDFTGNRYALVCADNVFEVDGPQVFQVYPKEMTVICSVRHQTPLKLDCKLLEEM